ncbi:hypothetical protein LTR66_006033 [Elasticomyces elasticus]|nr:hypothetical protein LTR66_006033 [Elasticomyces elasticus]KAK5006064.1 hypothetical protein LTR28_006942 [Elasticomyces elasticus]
MAPSNKPTGTFATLTAAEQKVLSLAFQCFEAMPKVDYKKLADLGGYKTAASATACYIAARKKLLAQVAVNAAPSDGKTEDGLTATTSKAAAAAGTAEDDDEEHAATTASAMKKRGRAPASPSEDVTEAVPKKRGRMTKAQKEAEADAGAADMKMEVGGDDGGEAQLGAPDVKEEDEDARAAKEEEWDLIKGAQAYLDNLKAEGVE